MCACVQMTSWGATVSTLDSKSSDRGSNQREVLCAHLVACNVAAFPALCLAMSKRCFQLCFVVVGGGLRGRVLLVLVFCVVVRRPVAVVMAIPKAGSTLRSSRAVPHPRSSRALRRLTSEVGRGPVHSRRYGRQRWRCDRLRSVAFRARVHLRSPQCCV